jgi:ABC-type tungstate transport system substrate-binding protein
VAISMRDAHLSLAMHVDEGGEVRIGRELARADLLQVLGAVAGSFGLAISEVGASMIVDGKASARRASSRRGCADHRSAQPARSYRALALRR